MLLRAKDQRHDQHTKTSHYRQISELLCSLQIPQGPAYGEKDENTSNHRIKLLGNFSRLNGTNHHHTQGTQEKGHRLQFKRTALDQTVKDQQQPLAQQNTAETRRNGKQMLSITAQQKCQTAQALKHRQNQKICYTVHTAGFGPQLSLEFFLPLRNGLQAHLHTADVDLIFLFQCKNIHRLSIDQNAVLGIGIGYGPASVIIPGQDRMVPGNRRGIDTDIVGLAAANDILPVSQGELAAVFHHQPGPDFRFFLKGQQRMQAPDQQHDGQHRRHIAQDANVYTHITFLRLSKTHQ